MLGFHGTDEDDWTASRTIDIEGRFRFDLPAQKKIELSMKYGCKEVKKRQESITGDFKPGCPLSEAPS